MEKQKEELERLATKIEAGMAGDEELLLYNRWFASFQKEEQPQIPVHLKESTKIAIKRRIKIQKIPNIYRIWPAAAAVLIIGLGALLYLNSTHWSLENTTAYTTYQDDLQDIVPIPKGASLQIDDGEVIELKPDGKSIISGFDGLSYQDGTHVLSSEGDTKKMSTTYATLTTPRGGEYQLILADGTKVWLNADSKLRYPLLFNKDAREVEIEGEGYFEVAKSEIPFFVKSKTQEIKVLGTHFNVNAYPDYNTVRTVLTEGRVQVSAVSSEGTDKEIVLSPGEGAMWNGKELSKKRVNVDAALAWKNGMFSFDDKTFTQVMDELARWYDVTIVYEGQVPQAKFFGQVYRNTNLSFVLGLLESAKVQYRLEQSKIDGEKRLIINSANNERR